MITRSRESTPPGGSFPRELWPLAGLVIVAFGPVFLGYARLDWRAHALAGSYTHAWLALPVLLWLLWSASRQPAMFEPRVTTRWPGYLLLAVGVALKVHGELLGYNVLRGMSLIPIALGVVGVLYSRRTVRALLFPIAFLVFIVPLPNFVIDAATVPLRGLSAGVVSESLAAAGYPVERAGLTLQLTTPEGGRREVFIDEGCSGIRSIVALLALGALFLHLQPIPPGWKVGLFLLLPALAVVGNLIRVGVATLVAYHVGTEAAEGFFHGASGLILFLVAIGGLVLLAYLPARESRGHDRA